MKNAADIYGTNPLPSLHFYVLKLYIEGTRAAYRLYTLLTEDTVQCDHSIDSNIATRDFDKMN